MNDAVITLSRLEVMRHAFEACDDRCEVCRFHQVRGRIDIPSELESVCVGTPETCPVIKESQ